ncbi:MAG: hypothetical protein ACRD0N_09640 [Acidimicrobiales bacterium]
MLRRLFLAAVALAVFLGLVGVLGVRSGTTSASGGGFELEVTYPAVGRPGLSVPWSATVRRAGGFDGPVVLATSAGYFDLFDENSLDPGPAKSTSDGEWIIWEFDPPERGDTFEVSLDTRMGPNEHWGKSAETAVLVNGTPAVSVTYRTRVMP